MEFAILAGEVVDLVTPLELHVLADSQLALIGGGCGEVVLA